MEQDNERRDPFDGPRCWHPVAIIEDRYGGIHCGGAWIAVANADRLHEGRMRADFVLSTECGGPHASDPEAMAFWREPPDWLAVGATPQEALDNLVNGIRPRVPMPGE
jgi:hypothetical protein